jgi:glycosyltransferase involved in cell wall biosynthesis
MPDTAREAPESSPVPSVHFAGDRKLSWNAIRSVASQVRRYRPDILHAFTPASLAWCVLGTSALRRRPNLISFRGIPRLLRHSDPSEWISYLSPRVRMHACESHAVMQSMMRSGIAADRLRVTYNTAWEFDLSESAEYWRSLWSCSPGDVVVGTVAHVRPIKGIDLLVRAMLEMTDVPNWKLVIVGKVDDGLVTALTQSPSLQGRVMLTGHLDQAPSAMQAFDLFVMPSRSEGLCRALIEAMTIGVCPIVSSAGGMKELVRHERDGLVFPIDDFMALSLAIRRLIGDHEQRRCFGRSAREHVQALCTPKVVVDQLEEMYACVMKKDWDDEFD